MWFAAQNLVAAGLAACLERVVMGQQGSGALQSDGSHRREIAVVEIALNFLGGKSPGVPIFSICHSAILPIYWCNHKL